MKRFLILLLVGVTLSACGVCKHTPTVTTIQKDTVYIHNTDTQYLRDSIYVFKDRIIKEKGDTVYIKETEIRYKDRWKEKEKIDTLYLTKYQTDTIEKQVEKELSFIQKFFINFGKIFSVILTLLVLYGGYKLYRKLTLKK